jgi:hypothetical protein
MEGKVDAVASGVQPPVWTRPAGRPSGDDVPPEETPVKRVPGSPVPAPDEIPPHHVFAPGFMRADRRGLVAYPGIGETALAGVVGRYLHATSWRTAAAAYRAADRLSR